MHSELQLSSYKDAIWFEKSIIKPKWAADESHSKVRIGLGVLGFSNSRTFLIRTFLVVPDHLPLGLLLWHDRQEVGFLFSKIC